ncbi:tetratricopeptide repeat protein [Salibacterium sp. K-3]
MALLLFHLMYIVLKKTSLWLMLLLSLPLVLYATTLFFSLSRGAMILFPIIWLVGLCFLRMREQVKYIVSTIWAFAGGLVFYIMGSQENAGSFSQLFMLLVAGGISALLVMGTCRILDRKMPSAPSKKWQAYLLPGIAVLAGAALVLDFVKQGILYSQLPEGIRHRLRDIGYETIFEDGRFTFFFDAFRMLKDAPLFGWGGDGWSVLYHSYQTEPYISNEVHSVLLEQLLNIGVIGLIVGTVVLAVYAVNSVRTFRKTAHPAIPAALTALLMLLGHGMIDFDFSFATVWLLFMLLLAIAVPAAPELPAFTIDRRSVAIGASGLAAVLVVLSSVYAFRFDIAERKAQAAAQLNGNEEILETLTDARAWNPNELSYIIDQASVAVELQKGDLLLELNNQFTDVEPLNSNAWLQSGNIYASFGRIEEAMERYEQALEYDPFNIDIYERIIHLTSEEAASLSQNGEKDKAAEVAAQAAGAYERYQSTMFEFRDNPQPGYKDLELNQSSIFLTGQAYMVQTKYQKGINVLQNVNKDNEELYLRSQALVIHALEKQGETQKAQTKLNNLISRNEQAAAYFEAYQQIF